MRGLTGEELKSAPKWATHYYIDTDNSVIYESSNLCWWVGLDEPLHSKVFDDGVRVIPKKPFDIEVYEFVDLEIGQAEINGDGIQLNMVDNSRSAIIYKRDLIAIARALGVTGDDLK